ncbi:BgTH12-00748 [Blumeria graminis f. sp. triticale]|uniref:BgTH12-00748 n=1 Tax=Blumeria graminis f. sp. triticale TaxID=1689686 RepID=A0A9W4DRL4_BLUGR|nr:BgTH12-00748 [Blumeria graminis f. sp. triticale]
MHFMSDNKTFQQNVDALKVSIVDMDIAMRGAKTNYLNMMEEFRSEKQLHGNRDVLDGVENALDKIVGVCESHKNALQELMVSFVMAAESLVPQMFNNEQPRSQVSIQSPQKSDTAAELTESLAKDIPSAIVQQEEVDMSTPPTPESDPIPTASSYTAYSALKSKKGKKYKYQSKRPLGI